MKEYYKYKNLSYEIQNKLARELMEIAIETGKPNIYQYYWRITESTALWEAKQYLLEDKLTRYDVEGNVIESAESIKNKKYVVKYFEVKTGKNRGVYFAIDNVDEDEMRHFMHSNGVLLGMLPPEYHRGFYKRHKVSNGIIITFSGYTTNQYNLKIAKRYMELMKEKGHEVIISK